MIFGSPGPQVTNGLPPSEGANWAPRIESQKNTHSRNNKQIKTSISNFLRLIFLICGLWTLELAIFDLNIGFYVKFLPQGQVLRSQFWRGGQKSPPKKSRKPSEASVFTYVSCLLTLFYFCRCSRQEMIMPALEINIIPSQP